MSEMNMDALQQMVSNAINTQLQVQVPVTCNEEEMTFNFLEKFNICLKMQEMLEYCTNMYNSLRGDAKGEEIDLEVFERDCVAPAVTDVIANIKEIWFNQLLGTMIENQKKQIASEENTESTETEKGE